MSDIIPCPHCKTRIIPTAARTCPSCSKGLDEPVQERVAPAVSPAIAAARAAAQSEKKRTTGMPILVGLVTAILGFGVFMSARQIEAGITVEHTGRHAGKAHLMDEVAKALGPTGSLMVWLGGVGVCAVWYVLARKSDQARLAHERSTAESPQG